MNEEILETIKRLEFKIDETYQLINIIAKSIVHLTNINKTQCEEVTNSISEIHKQCEYLSKTI